MFSSRVVLRSADEVWALARSMSNDLTERQMRKLISSTFMSLDGVIQLSAGPGEGDFPYGD